MPDFPWNLYSVCANVPSGCNNGNKWLDMICGVHKLKMNDATID